MKTRIEYRCKFCGQNRVMECEIPEACPTLSLEKWKKLLVCNDCADYERSRRDTEDLISKHAINLRVVRQGGLKADRLRELEDKSRSNLTILTKRFCGIVCRRRGVPSIWDAEIVEQMMDRPEECRTILSHYLNSLAQMSLAKNIA